MEAQTWGRVVALHAWVESRLAQDLHRRHAIGLSEYRALSQLAAAEGGELRMQELAELIGLNQSSVSRLVVRLEAAGLTRRDICPTTVAASTRSSPTRAATAWRARARRTRRRCATRSLRRRPIVSSATSSPCCGAP